MRNCLSSLLELLGSTDEQKLGRVREMVREGVDWEGIEEFLDRMRPPEIGEEAVEASTAGSSREAQQRTVSTPIAFDEWIAEVFGSPDQPDDMTGIE